jgi:hypothetical protein
MDLLFLPNCFIDFDLAMPLDFERDFEPSFLLCVLSALVYSGGRLSGRC